LNQQQYHIGASQLEDSEKRALAQNESVLSTKQFEPIPEIVDVHSKPIFKLLRGFKL